jgi:hypothetical protein
MPLPTRSTWQETLARLAELALRNKNTIDLYAQSAKLLADSLGEDACLIYE